MDRSLKTSFKEIIQWIIRIIIIHYININLIGNKEHQVIIC